MSPTDVSAAPRQQKSVYFSGTVQGVGFRYTAHRIASGFQVVGTVRNLRDGRVEVVAEGKTEEIENFLAAIRQRFAGNIRDETSSMSKATGQFQTFSILR